MRIELFNKKTVYEFFEYNTERHIDFNSNIVRASLTNRERTLGPDSIYIYVTTSDWINNDLKFDVEKYLFKKLENAFIDYLNKNVGLECLIKKEEIPLEIYDRIKA